MYFACLSHTTLQYPAQPLIPITILQFPRIVINIIPHLVSLILAHHLPHHLAHKLRHPFAKQEFCKYLQQCLIGDVLV